MSDSSYDSRKRDSIDYLNRREDLITRQTIQAEQAADVFEAIADGNEARVRSILGVQPADAAVANDNDSNQPPPRALSGDEQFAAHADRLQLELECSTFIPGPITADWIARLGRVALAKPLDGLTILDELRADFSRAQAKYEPRPSIWDMDVTRMMAFSDEMKAIDRELKWLRNHMSSVLSQRIQAALGA